MKYKLNLLIENQRILNEIGDFNNIKVLKYHLTPRGGIFKFEKNQFRVVFENIKDIGLEIPKYKKQIRNLDKRDHYNIGYSINGITTHAFDTDLKTFFIIINTVSHIIKDTLPKIESKYDNIENMDYPIFNVFETPKKEDDNKFQKIKYYSKILAYNLPKLGTKGYFDTDSELEGMKGYAFWKQKLPLLK